VELHTWRWRCARWRAALETEQRVNLGGVPREESVALGDAAHAHGAVELEVVQVRPHRRGRQAAVRGQPLELLRGGWPPALPTQLRKQLQPHPGIRQRPLLRLQLRLQLRLLLRLLLLLGPDLLKAAHLLKPAHLLKAARQLLPGQLLRYQRDDRDLDALVSHLCVHADCLAREDLVRFQDVVTHHHRNPRRGIQVSWARWRQMFRVEGLLLA